MGLIRCRHCRTHYLARQSYADDSDTYCSTACEDAAAFASDEEERR